MAGPAEKFNFWLTPFPQLRSDQEENGTLCYNLGAAESRHPCRCGEPPSRVVGRRAAALRQDERTERLERDVDRSGPGGQNEIVPTLTSTLPPMMAV
jgi:hypothetical protein